MDKYMQTDSDPEQDIVSNSFTFSSPSPISSPDRTFNVLNHPNNVHEGSGTTQSFAFAAPDPIPSPERTVNNDNHSVDVFRNASTQNFAFAAPAFIEKDDNSDEMITSTKEISTKEIESIKRKKLLLALENLKKSKVPKPLGSPKDVKKTKAPKSPLSAHDIKKTDAFAQLERNTKKDVKLEIAKSITCAGVPESLLVKSTAQKYFEQFGEVLKIIHRPKRNMINVYFATTAAAEKAFLKANSYMGHKFTTAWTTAEMLNVKPKKVETTKSKIASFLNLDDEVREELEAMKGLEYNLPEVNNLKSLNNKTGFAAKAVKKAKELKASREAPKRILKPPRTAKPIQSEKLIVTPKIESPKIDLKAKKIPQISSSMIEEYQNQIRQLATTSEEKYKILEARDRLMRLKQNKQQSLATAKITKGTCLDMCPEKERYMREYQRTLSSYEQMGGSDYKINHLIAIKQYSRSSADQEEPMPHDLRPVKSLKMTMSYLLNEICDLCDEEDASLTEWYHFLWDRMRSIRKDITLQQLCCKETVELVEQCTRFHILASERLCAEEMSVFDPKINSENLTKCLQTLKYMYYDLREHGITCENEPEFQAYVILLNLNNGSFITDLSTLPPAVQQSPEIKFALSIYSAMAMDNYCRFFKLVRNTTYLNACILLRYFNQVREKALSIMVKAYCRGSANTEYPLYEMVDILGFEDPDELLYFCSKVGLRCDSESLYIKLNKDAYHAPKSNIEQSRALNVVLSKRLLKNQRVGQCIAGGVLPEKTYERHKPHCSFNSRGYLLPSSYDAKDQSLSNPYDFSENDDDVQFVSEQRDVKTSPKLNNNTEQKKPANISFRPMQQTSDVFRPKHSTTESTGNNIFKNANSNIFASTSNSTPSIFAKPQVPVFSAIPTKTSTLPTNSPFNTTVNKGIFSGSNSQTNLFKVPTTPPSMKQDKILPPSDRVSIKRRLDDPEIIAEKKSYTVSEDLLKKKLEAEEKQKAEAKRIAEERRKIEEKLKAEQEKLEYLKKISELSRLEYELLEMEVIEEECSSIVRAEINRISMVNSLSEKIYDTMLDNILKSILDEQLFIQDMLIEVGRRLQDKLIIKYYRIWKLWASRRRVQRREALDNTPVWLQPESLQDRARKLYTPQQKIAIEHAREVKRRSREIERKERKAKQTSIEFIVLVGLKENMKSFEVEPSNQHTFWKLVISWPLLDNKNLTMWRHKNLVNKYLSPEDSTLETILIQHKPSPQERLDICIRHFDGLLCENCLIGTDGLLFIVSADEDARFIERRLTKSVLSREKLMPIPVVILVFGDDTTNPNVVKPSPGIENLLESGHVSEYSILYERSTDEDVVLKVMQTAILWLAINRSPMVPLEMNYLKNVFDDCLTEELWLRIQSHLSQKPQFSRALCDPNFVINLHNEAVNHVMDIILDVESMSYTDFAPELKIFLSNKRSYPCTYEYFDNFWKHPEYRAELERIMSSFVFPPWRDAWPILDMLELNDALLRYCRQLLSNEDSVKIADDIMADLFLIVGPNENNCPNFTDVIIHIMRRKICDIGGNTRVVYNKNHIKHFQSLPWWFKSPTLTIYAAEHEEEYEIFVNGNFAEKQISESNPQLESDFKLMSIDELNKTYEQLDEEVPVMDICHDISTQASEVHSVTDEIDKQMEEYRRRSQNLETKLKAALREGSEILDS